MCVYVYTLYTLYIVYAPLWCEAPGAPEGGVSWGYNITHMMTAPSSTCST